MTGGRAGRRDPIAQQWCLLTLPPLSPLATVLSPAFSSSLVDLYAHIPVLASKAFSPPHFARCPLSERVVKAASRAVGGSWRANDCYLPRAGFHAVGGRSPAPCAMMRLWGVLMTLLGRTR